MSKVNTSLFQDKMRRAGYTLETLSAAIGRSRTGLFNKIHNKTDFRAKEIDKISALLKLTKADKERIFFAVNVE
jgi:hypothetical protein